MGSRVVTFAPEPGCTHVGVSPSETVLPGTIAVQ